MCVCVAEVLCYDGGFGRGGGGVQESLEREGGRSAKAGIEEMNWVCLQGSHPQVQGLWDSPGRRKCAPLCAGRKPQSG